MPVETIRDTINVNVSITAQSDQSAVHLIWSPDRATIDNFFSQRSPIFYGGHSVEIKNLCLYSDVRSIGVAAAFTPSQSAISRESIQNEFYSWLFKQARKEVGLLMSTDGSNWAEIARIPILNMQYEKPARVQIDTYVSPDKTIGKNTWLAIRINDAGNNILQQTDWIRVIGTLETTSYYSIVSDSIY